MENGTYNGWTNRDTWLVMLWLDNDEKNYKGVQHLVEGVGTKLKLRDLTCCELMERLKRFNYGDEINWHNVNVNEVKKALLEEYEG